MKSGEIAPAGAGSSARYDSVRPSTNPVVACLLLVMFVSGACLTAFGCGETAKPLDDNDPGIPASSLAVSATIVASPKTAYIGEEVTFWANASSTTGSTLTITILYDAFLPPFPTPNPDTAVTVNVTGNPGNVVQKFTYNSLGNFTYGEDTMFWVRLYVNDGSVNSSFYTQVYVRENSSPVFFVAPGDASTPMDVPLNLSIEVYDPDSDMLDILWEFGDGTTASNTTDGTLADRYVNQTHVWDPYIPPGTGGYSLYYMLNVSATDPFGNNITANVTVTVTVPANRAPTIALVSSSAKVQPGDELLLFANATDAEGDPLTWTFNYSDGTSEVVHTDWSEPRELVWCNMTHVYDAVGNYTVTLYVSDALEGYQIFPHNKSTSVPVTVAANRKPGVTTNITVSPESPEINATIGFIDVYLSIQAVDVDGDVLTATWYIGDAADPVVNVSAGGIAVYTFRQIMTLTEPGSYNVSVVVTDGYEGHEVTVSRTINVMSNNLPPSLVVFDFVYASGEHGVPGEEIGFVIVISDPEQDTIAVTLEFGDGSPRQYFNLTDYDANGSAALLISHVYEHPGVYTVTLRYTDNKIGILNHSKVVTSQVTIEEVYVSEVTEWDWWDYTALSLVFLIPVIIGVRMFAIKRRVLRLESEGLTLEEARIKDEEKLMDELLKGGKGDG